MSNNSLVEREITQGVLSIGTPKAYQYDAALVEAAKATVRQGMTDVTTAGNSIIAQAQTILDAIRNQGGYPLMAATAAAMTDQTKIYVYTGSETGYVFGDWYFYNGSAWEDGGVYNSTAFNSDKTLSVDGAAADAQCVGRLCNDFKLPLLVNGSIQNSGNAYGVSFKNVLRIPTDCDFIYIYFVGNPNGADSYLLTGLLFKDATDDMTSSAAYADNTVTKKSINSSELKSAYPVLRLSKQQFEGYDHIAMNVWLYNVANGNERISVRIATNQYSLKVAFEHDQTITDPTLTNNGKAADAAAVGNKFSYDKNTSEAVLGEIENIIGNKAAVYDIGFTRDREDVFAQHEYANWASTIQPCSEDEVFYVWGIGGSASRLLMFVDNAGNILFETGSGASKSVPTPYTAPENSAYVVANTRIDNANYKSFGLYKDLAIKDRVNNIEEKQDGVFNSGLSKFDAAPTLGASFSSGGNMQPNNRLIFSKIYLNKKDLVTLNEPNFKIYINIQDEDNHNIYNGAWVSGPCSLIVPYDGYVTVGFAYYNDSSLDTSLKDTYISYVAIYHIETNTKINETTHLLDNAQHVGSNSNPPLTLLHFSDCHNDALAVNRILKEAENLSVDDMICTGDIVGNSATHITSWWPENVMTCIGNHDSASYSSETGYDWTALSMANRDAYYIAPFESNWDITHTSGTSYYYKDYNDQKVRLIVMDSMLYSDNGEEATAQNTWLENLLADAITNELHVLIAIHGPHGGAVPVDCSFSKYNERTMPTYQDCNTPQAVIDIVATKINAGLHFIGYLCGHEHNDDVWDAEGDGKQLMYCVTCAAVSYAPQWINHDQHRSETEDAYNLVIVDTTHTLIKLIRGGGADIDDHMRTRKAICINYSTGEVVGEIL